MIKLCDIQNCTGCGACLNACKHKAISMKENEDGFLFPEINYDKCISCNLCTKVCPELNIDNIERHNVKECYASYAKSNLIRERSSSGGIFSVIANFILNQSGIVVGAAMQDDYKLNHLCISNLKDLTLLQGSKYFQSDTKYTFSEIKSALKSNKTVLFCGSPCQVAGLKSFLNKSETKNLITCDFICHGVPSYLPLKKLIKSSSKMQKISASQICFRNLRKWNIGIYLKKKLFCWEYLYPVKGTEDFYFKAYLNGYMNRECCYQCPYTNIQRTGDITIADFWNIEPKDELKSNNLYKGVSFIGINTEKGLQIINIIKNQLFLQERSISEIKNNNAQFNHPAYRPKERDTFYLSIKNKTWDEITIEYNYKPKGLSLVDTIKIYKNIIFSLKKSK